jgi:dolichol-phosphate mannosyltransferase
MIWILIPAYNEEAALPHLLPHLAQLLAEKDYRLVVVDDGSNDRSPDILKELQPRLPIDVITHTLNRGLGETERDGFEYIAARAQPDDIILRVEGDATHDPQYLFDLVNKLEQGYDVVIASRFQPGGGQKGVEGFRTWVSSAATVFMRLVFPIPGVKEYTCGYRAYRARWLQDAIRIFGNTLIQLRGLGFTSTLEIIIKLHLMGAHFVEVPFVLRYDQKASASKMVANVTTLGYLVMALLYHWPWNGWKHGCRGLAELYRQDNEAAVARYNLRSRFRPHRLSRIGF